MTYNIYRGFKFIKFIAPFMCFRTAGCLCVMILAIQCPQAWSRSVRQEIPARHLEIYQHITQKRFSCGQNALYALLRIRGKSVTAAEVKAALGEFPPYPGHSLSELRRAADELGMSCSVRHLTADQLQANANLPVIAHFHVTKSGASGTGHYVILLEIDDDFVRYFDPIALQFNRKPPDAFLKQWSGYILQPIESSWMDSWSKRGSITPLLFLAAVCIVLLNLSPLVVRAVKYTQRRMLVAIMSTALVGIQCQTVTAIEYNGVWRDPSHESANVCYALLALHGIKVDYPDLISDFPDNNRTSMKDLRDICIRRGLSAIVVKIGPDDLMTLALPIVVHISARLEDGGSLSIITSRDANGVWVLHGSTAVVNRLSWDVLRRNWSGYALVVEKSTFPRDAIAATGALLLVASVSMLRRTMRRLVLKKGEL